MSNKVQTDKNIKLTCKLLDYLANSSNVPNFPEDVSFVPFSKTDKKLNIENEKLIGFLSEEKPVVIAEEPKTSKESWKITPVNF